MLYERLYLKEGLDAGQALAELRRQITAGRNTISGGTYDRRRDGYIRWAEVMPQVLSGLTHDSAIVTMLYTDRYWHIRTGSPDPWQTLDGEAKFQIDRLEGMANDLQERVNRLSAAPGHITVLDTNVLLHYQRPDSVRWDAIVHQPAVRLVVPLRVVEELDAKKWSRRDDLAGRARRMLSYLEGEVRPDGAPGTLRDNVTIEVPIDRGPRLRPDDADQEQHRCQEVVLFQRAGPPSRTGRRSHHPDARACTSPARPCSRKAAAHRLTRSLPVVKVGHPPASRLVRAIVVGHAEQLVDHQHRERK